MTPTRVYACMVLFREEMAPGTAFLSLAAAKNTTE
jgi:hypothetical protein